MCSTWNTLNDTGKHWKKGRFESYYSLMGLKTRLHYLIYSKCKYSSVSFKIWYNEIINTQVL